MVGNRLAGLSQHRFVVIGHFQSNRFCMFEYGGPIDQTNNLAGNTPTIKGLCLSCSYPSGLGISPHLIGYCIHSASRL